MIWRHRSHRSWCWLRKLLRRYSLIRRRAAGMRTVYLDARAFLAEVRDVGFAAHALGTIGWGRLDVEAGPRLALVGVLLCGFVGWW